MKPEHEGGFISRRDWLALSSKLMLGGALLPVRVWANRSVGVRQYHVSLSAQAVVEDPDLPSLMAQAGVSCVWLGGFFYGYWPWPIDSLVQARGILRSKGIETQIVNVPLGHPGDSLGARDGNFPLTPPASWKLACHPNGKTYAGTSVHPPATIENAEALKQLRQTGFAHFFLDDDFRLARGPGDIGGCFCAEHQLRFLRRTGLPESRWPELLDDVRDRRLTPLLREWLEFTCDDLSNSFRIQRRAAAGNLGIMVMYLGAEKAGIRLSDYRHCPMRVGELMFDDAAFAPVKGKTDELFSALFHRRFVAPEEAWSETTAFPAHKLSVHNLAAKLVISTIADVRHTCFMSGVTPFPKAYWSTLQTSMARQAQFHATLAGHQPHGPFKHYWGEASRYVGDDRPFSLFLATGVPFEVTDRPAKDGWTFLSDADAKAVAGGRLRSRGTVFLARSEPGFERSSLEVCPEELGALFAFKHRIQPKLGRIPFVENDEPALLAWYPTARAAFLWNPQETRSAYRVRCGAQNREVILEGLESALLTELRP
jgi:hypothetical protein